MQNNLKKPLLILLSILGLVITISCCLGSVNIGFSSFLSIVSNQIGFSTSINFTPQQQAVLVALRLPRVCLGVFIGAGLGISGAAMQGLFRNPLAEPGLIGIQSGAALFAVMMIVLQVKVFTQLTSLLGYYALAIAAFTGACITTFLVYRLAIQNGKTVITTLLLSGIAINALAGSFTGLLTYMATDEQLRSITFWSLGSLGGASWQTLGCLFPFIAIPVFVLPFFAKALNAIALGEAQASHLGINVGFTKKIIIVLATMAVGASVAVAGIIGFIGLIIPHILRMACGADNKIIIPASAILGAAVLTLADLVSRTIVAPTELPIGIITALIGTPVFIYIINSQRKKNYQ
ncbi:MAG: iron ABC transporter permease [Sphingobacteriales bacterium]|nr:MAG: iron ABC transporter permease [Sphingobacteriales bacterium]